MSKCRQCGTELVWDEKVKSAGGKMIPLETNGSKHQCKFSKFNKTPDKTLNITPMDAVYKHDKEIIDIKKRLDKIEIEMKWGGNKGEAKPESQPKSDNINWEEHKVEETDKKDSGLEALRNL